MMIANCDKNKNPFKPDKNEFIYPIKIGYLWEYSKTYTAFHFRPDTIAGHLKTDTSVASVAVIKILRKETIHDSVGAYVFQETENQAGQISIDYSYYLNHNTGLYFYAYHGGGYFLPKNSHRKRILFKGKYFNSIRDLTSYIILAVPDNYSLEDSLIYENPPLQCLKYPMKMDNQWTFRFPGNPWHIDKRIIGHEKLEVPAGKFDCFKIQWLYDIDGNNIWDDDIVLYDYICNKGLIKRSILIKNEIWTGEQGLDPVGLMDSKIEILLTKSNF
jgi:hypothetical protein